MKKLLFLTILMLLIAACGSPKTVEIADTPVIEEPVVEEPVVEEPTTIPPTAAPTPTSEPPTAIPEPTATMEPEKGTWNNPFPFFYKGDATFTWSVDDWSGTFEAEMGFLELLWGQDAWLAVQSANIFNDEPDEGMEYLLVKLWVKNVGDTVIEDLSEHDFGILSKGNFYETPFGIVEPSPSLDIEGLFPDGEVEGWIVLQISVGDDLPLFAFSDDPMDAVFIQLVRP